MFERLKRWARAMHRDVLALYLAGRDPRVPWHAKALAVATAAYALSPIDLIPDFIPVIGYLDDLLIVPAMLALSVWLIPPDVMSDLRRKAETQLENRKPRSWTAAIVVISIWVVLVVLLIRWLFPSLS